MKRKGWLHGSSGPGPETKQQGSHNLANPALLCLRGQTSLEALVSFAALLAALGLLLVSAGSITRDFSSSVESSREKLLLSEEALALDTAGFCLSGAAIYQNISALPSQEGWSISYGKGGASEPVFNSLSGGFDGKIRIQGKKSEPV